MTTCSTSSRASTCGRRGRWNSYLLGKYFLRSSGGGDPGVWTHTHCNWALCLSANNVSRSIRISCTRAGSSGVWGRLRSAVSRYDERRFQRPIRHLWPSRLLPGLFKKLNKKSQIFVRKNKIRLRRKQNHAQDHTWSISPPLFSSANWCQVRSVERGMCMFLFSALFF